MHCYNGSVLNIGLFQFSSQISVTLVSMLFTLALVNPIYQQRSMFLFTCFISFFSPSDCHISIVVNNQTLERSIITRIIGRSMSTPDFISWCNKLNNNKNGNDTIFI